MGGLGEVEEEDMALPDRLRAVRRPSSVVLWAVATFFAIFVGGAALEGIVQTDGKVLVASLFGGVVAAGWMVFRGRPRYLRLLEITREECRGKDWRGKDVVFSAAEVEVLSAQGTVQLSTLTFERWGWLHFRVGGQWLAIQWDAAGAKQLFWRVWRRFPHAVGLSGDQQIEVPASDDREDAAEWLLRVRKRCQWELGRQCRQFLFFGSLLGVSGMSLILMGVVMMLKERKFTRTVQIAAVGCGIVGLAVVFLGMARRQWMFLRRVVVALDVAGRSG